MPTKGKVKDVARSTTSKDVAKPATPSSGKRESDKRIKVGDWVMFESELFVQLHLVAKPVSKTNITTACGLENPPDYSGRPPGPRCKRCTKLRDVTAS